jgi:hypothetical protein
MYFHPVLLSSSMSLFISVLVVTQIWPMEPLQVGLCVPSILSTSLVLAQKCVPGPLLNKCMLEMLLCKRVASWTSHSSLATTFYGGLSSLFQTLALSREIMSNFQAEKWLHFLDKLKENKSTSTAINLTVFPTLNPKEEVCIHGQSLSIFIPGRICFFCFVFFFLFLFYY